MRLAIFISLFLSSVALGRPNVVIVLTDDQGYPELSAHGNPVLETPHLDKLRSESVRFSDFHVAPMCTPTRGQLLTGVDAARNGAINVSSGRTLLNASLPTMATIFSANDYATGLFGKWHLGDNFPYRPQDRGFDETLWFPSSHINSVPDVWNNDYFDDTYHRNGTLTEYQGYCTDIFFDEAIAWMKKQAAEEKPFLTWIPTNAPHSPYWVPQKYTDAMEKKLTEAEKAGTIPKLPPQKRGNLVKYLAMIKNIDDNVGKLDAFLSDGDIADETILIFLTDNGSTMGEDYYPAGMRGRKTQLWEGGHRVPCFIRWPGGNIGEPRDIGGLTEVQDILPTLTALVDAKMPDAPIFDGENLAPVLEGREEVDPERMIVINYSRMPHGFDYPSPDAPSIITKDGAGVLWKRWRLLNNRELYDLQTDPMQERNVISEHPEVAAKMRDYLGQWWKRVDSIANKPQKVTIGHDAENPMMLTACEWLDVFIDQQKQIRRANLKNGWWELEVHQAGEYEFEMRRWPRESGLAISEPAPETKIADGVLPAGVALDIRRARLHINGVTKFVDIKPGQEAATVRINLKKGPTRLYTWFDDERNQAIVGAYYVYVKRLTGSE